MSAGRPAGLLLLLFGLGGCITNGRVFDDTAASRLVLGQTSQSEAIAVLGPATQIIERQDGMVIVRWRYEQFGPTGLVERRVVASFREDRLVDLFNPVRDEAISPF